jgi:hypothetical protein
VRVIEWKQASVAGLKLRRFTGHVGGIEVGAIEFDGSNQLSLAPFLALQMRQD